MKIGIVCPYNLYRPGGVLVQIKAHQKELQRLGHDVTLIAPKPRGFTGEPEPGVVLVGTSTELNTPFKTKADISIHAGLYEIGKFLKEEQFDILHFHEPWIPMLPMQILNASTSVNVATFHAKMPGMRIYKAIGKAITPYTKSIIKKLDYMVGVSETATMYLNTLVDEPVEIIPNSIDLKVFDPEKTSIVRRYDDDLKTIFYMNRLEKRKGPDLLLKAYKELVEEHDDLRLIMASDGDMRKELEVYVAAYDLPNVEFLGFISDEEKLQLYKTADVYCSPAPYGESFGLVMLEAMAMQTPLVAGDNPGYQVPLGDRAKDYLVDPTITSVLVKRLEDMIYDEDKRRRYIEWSRKEASKYSFTTTVAQYESIYKKLLKGKK
ncbi:MAG: glycosyltransferase family 4 protein [Candidatus Saccharimonadales bacterium]|nr:glycosyltransferase family 4 protein [Candidatus Saccharimonadales bacterium]